MFKNVVGRVVAAVADPWLLPHARIFGIHRRLQRHRTSLSEQATNDGCNGPIHVGVQPSNAEVKTYQNKANSAVIDSQDITSILAFYTQ